MRPRAGSHDSDGINVDTNWHTHDLHQVLYTFEGSVDLEDPRARFLLPPRLAALIPAGVRHRTRLRGQRSASIFFPPAWLTAPGERIRILKPSSLMREMVLEGLRWPINRPEEAVGRNFFRTFALLCADWINSEALLHIPTTDDAKLRKAMSYTQSHLAEARFHEVCRAANSSERSLRRRFLSLAGMSWAEYRHRSRLIQAMRLLESRTPAIAEVAAQVGFASLSGFSKAFSEFAGESPRRYRERIAR